MISKYIDCNNQEVRVCNYYFNINCPRTCKYCGEIEELGVGTMMPEDVKGLEKKIVNDKENN